MSATKAPWFWKGSMRSFKQSKRKEFRAVQEAYEKFRLGCAFVNGYEENEDKLHEALRQWKEAMSVKNWGR